MVASPVSFDDILAARERLRPYLTPTPFREYPQLNNLVGHGIRVWVKHENHQPAQTFKIRNGISAITALTPEQRARGVIGASTGMFGGVPVGNWRLGNTSRSNTSRIWFLSTTTMTEPAMRPQQMQVQMALQEPMAQQSQSQTQTQSLGQGQEPANSLLP